jgi:hypothetical protein
MQEPKDALSSSWDSLEIDDDQSKMACKCVVDLVGGYDMIFKFTPAKNVHVPPEII